jgi:hypothetical protein
MKTPKLKKWDKLEVTWHDASVESATDSDKFIKNYQRCIRRTLGYYVGSKLDTLFITETDDRDADVWDVTPQDCERINAIPWGMCIEVKVLI